MTEGKSRMYKSEGIASRCASRAVGVTSTPGRPVGAAARIWGREGMGAVEQVPNACTSVRTRRSGSDLGLGATCSK
eukprot:1250989-Pleurochrysis_carterae.AAC.3